LKERGSVSRSTLKRSERFRLIYYFRTAKPLRAADPLPVPVAKPRGNFVTNKKLTHTRDFKILIRARDEENGTSFDDAFKRAKRAELPSPRPSNYKLIQTSRPSYPVIGQEHYEQFEIN
jgi:hypothetical protein